MVVAGVVERIVSFLILFYHG